LGLDFNDELRSLLPDVRIRTGVIVIGRAPGFNSASTGLRAGDVVHSLSGTTIESDICLLFSQRVLNESRRSAADQALECVH